MLVKCCPRKGEAAGCLLGKTEEVEPEEGAYLSPRSFAARSRVLAVAATACAGGHVSTVGDGSMEKVAATGLWSEVLTSGQFLNMVLVR